MAQPLLNQSPGSDADGFKKGSAMCYHVYVTMHVKDPLLSVVRVGNCVPLAGFSLSLYRSCAEQECECDTSKNNLLCLIIFSK